MMYVVNNFLFTNKMDYQHLSKSRLKQLLK